MENTPKEIIDLNAGEKEAIEQPTIFADIFIDTSAYEKSIRNARNWLYFIGALQIIMGIVQYLKLEAYSNNMRWVWPSVNIIIGLAYIGLAVLSYKQPVSAFIVGLILYIAVNVWSIYATEGASLTYYWILKILVIIALVKAIKSAKEYSTLKAGMGHE